jgi:hypothetical protein
VIGATFYGVSEQHVRYIRTVRHSLTRGMAKRAEGAYSGCAASGERRPGCLHHSDDNIARRGNASALPACGDGGAEVRGAAGLV